MRLGGVLGPSWGRLGAILGLSWGPLGAPWRRLGAVLEPTAVTGVTIPGGGPGER